MKSSWMSAMLLGLPAVGAVAIAGEGAIAAETVRYDETPITCEFYTEDRYADDCGEFSMTRSSTSVNFNYIFNDAAIKFLGPATPVNINRVEGETFYVYEVLAKHIDNEQYEINGICVANETVDVSICQSDASRYVYSNE